MASRRSRGKARYQRRRAHVLAVAGARPGLVAAAEAVLEQPLQPYQKQILEGIEERAKRKPCPECGLSQKVKRDGTMGTHSVTTETPGVRRVCEGTGRKPA